MKILIKVLLFIVIFVAGYALGNFIPWSGFSFVGGESILGSAKLEVKVTMDNGTPVPNLEVDVAEKPGPPKRGGVAITSQDGIANFDIQSGNYFIYFNSGNFPQNLKEPEPTQIQVSEGNVSKKTIILTTKKN